VLVWNVLPYLRPGGVSRTQIIGDGSVMIRLSKHAHA
jgi:hypothetical protein